MLGLSLKGETEIDHKTDWFHLGYNLLANIYGNLRWWTVGWAPDKGALGRAPRDLYYVETSHAMRQKHEAAGAESRNIGSAPDSLMKGWSLDTNVGTFQRDELEKCISGCDGCDGWSFFPKFKGCGSVAWKSPRELFLQWLKDSALVESFTRHSLHARNSPRGWENKAKALELEILHPLTRTAGTVGLQMWGPT